MISLKFRQCAAMMSVGTRSKSQKNREERVRARPANSWVCSHFLFPSNSYITRLSALWYLENTLANFSNFLRAVYRGPKAQIAWIWSKSYERVSRRSKIRKSNIQKLENSKISPKITKCEKNQFCRSSRNNFLCAHRSLLTDSLDACLEEHFGVNPKDLVLVHERLPKSTQSS